MTTEYHAERLGLVWNLGKFVLTDRSTGGKVHASAPLRWLAVAIIEDIARKVANKAALFTVYDALASDAFAGLAGELPLHQTQWKPQGGSVIILKPEKGKGLSLFKDGKFLSPGMTVRFEPGQYFNTDDDTAKGAPFPLTFSVAQEKTTGLSPVIIEALPNALITLISTEAIKHLPTITIKTENNVNTHVPVIVRGLKVRGAFKGSGGIQLRSWSSLYVDHILNLTLTDCEFAGSQNIGFDKVYASFKNHPGVDIRNVTSGHILRCVFDNVSNTGDIPIGTKYTLSISELSENVEFIACVNVQIEGCYFGSGGHGSLTLRDCANFTVDRCVFWNRLHTGIGLQQNCQDCSFKRSLFAGMGARAKDSTDGAIHLQLLDALRTVVAFNVFMSDPEAPPEQCNESGIDLMGQRRQACVPLGEDATFPVCVDMTGWPDPAKYSAKTLKVIGKPTCPDKLLIPGCGRKNGLSSVGIGCFPTTSNFTPLKEITESSGYEKVCEDWSLPDCPVSVFDKPSARICVKTADATVVEISQFGSAWNMPKGSVPYTEKNPGRTAGIRDSWIVNNLLLDLGRSAVSLSDKENPYNGGSQVQGNIIARNIIFGQRSAPVSEVQAKMKTEKTVAKALSTNPALISYTAAGAREGLLENFFLENIVGRRESQPTGMTPKFWTSFVKPKLVADAIAGFDAPKAVENTTTVIKRIESEAEIGIAFPNLSGSWLKYVFKSSGGLDTVVADPATDWCVRLPRIFAVPNDYYIFNWASVSDLNSSVFGSGNTTARGLGLDFFSVTSIASAFPGPAWIPKLTLGKTSLTKKTGLSMKNTLSTVGQIKGLLMFRPWEPIANLKLGAVLKAGALGAFQDEAEAIDVATDFFGNQLTPKNYNSFRGAWVPK